MRRRRTAAPSSGETEATTTSAESTLSESAESVNEIRTPPDNPSGEHYAAPAPDSAVTAADVAASEEAVPEKPKRARRASTARKKAAEAEPVVEPAVVPVEDPVAAALVAAAAPVAAAAESDAPVEEKPRRSRRRSSKAAAAEGDTPPPAEAREEAAPPVSVGRPAPVTIEPAPELSEVVPVSELVSAAESPAADEKPRRSRRRGGGRKTAAAEDAAETTAPAPEAGTPAATASEEPSAAPKRTRGPRRIAVTPAAEATAAPAAAAPVVEEAPATPAAGDEADGKPRRTRGTRRKSAARVIEADGTTTVVAERTTALPGVAEPATPPPARVYQPLPEEVLARLAEAKVVVRKGVAELVVSGDPRLPIWFFVNTEMVEDPEAGRDVARRQIRYAYEAGVRIFTVLAHLPWKMRSGERRFEPLDESLRFVAENAPDALILPRLIFSPPASWERAHPDEMIRYADGSTGDVSLASRPFWEEEAPDALRAAVEHVAEGPYAERVFGFYLEHGEWFHEKGRGYDRSEANAQGFRAWLRQHYKNNFVALRTAWHDGDVTFENAEIPGYPPPAQGPVFFGEREGRWVDFHEYSSDVVAQVVLRLARAVKEASGNRSAVAVSYGYTLELPRAASGHLALAQVLNAPQVDILTGPLSYGGRMPGGSAPLPAPVDSVTLAGKLWVSEDDTKTFLASAETPDTYNPKIGTAEGTRAVHARNFGAALARGTGISWMDLWGEGWLDDRETWQSLGRLVQIADRLATRRRNPRTRPVREPDVAVLVDERSFFDVRADEDLLGHLVSFQRDALLRSGARVGFYLLSDLAKKNFPEEPKLLLFLNAFHIPGDVRAAITQRFQDGGRTLAWLYGPGCREANPAELIDVIGMQLRLQPWGSKMGSQIVDGRSPLSDGLRGQRIGEEKRTNPSYYVSDPRALAVGEYVHTGNPSIAVRKHPRWQSVFIGEPTLTVPLLRGLYRLAGVPVATVDDDVAWMTDNLISLHSAPGGGTTLYLPEEGVLYDLWAEETLATGGFGARLSMPPRGTRLLFYGSEAEVARFGGDPKAGPTGLAQEELPPAPAPFAFEAVEARGPAEEGEDISPEDAALLEAALGGELPVPDKDEDGEGEVTAEAGGAAPTAEAAAAAEEGEGAGRKKRRRRRRGRGRDEAESEEPAALLEGVLSTPGELPDGEDGDEASDAEAAEAAPVRRPSLEELLPLSELSDETELPPIPDEFLPLDTEALLPATAAGATAAAGAAAEGETAAEGGEGGEAALADGARPRRPRRPRFRRGRRGGAGEEGESGEASAPEDYAPPAGGTDTESP